MAEVQINSMIDGIREFPYKIGDKAETFTFDPGRNYLEDDVYKALKKNKGFMKALQNGDFVEPGENEVKTDSEKLKLKKDFDEKLAKQEESMKNDHDKLVASLKKDHSKEIGALKKQLENVNDSLIAVTKQLETVKSEYEILKKGAKG